MILLGPCRCQGCGNLVYWGYGGRRSARYLAWRNVAGPHHNRRHYCQGGLRG